jgi:hypothetical protein
MNKFASVVMSTKSTIESIGLKDLTFQPFFAESNLGVLKKIRAGTQMVLPSECLYSSRSKKTWHEAMGMPTVIGIWAGFTIALTILIMNDVDIQRLL